MTGDQALALAGTLGPITLVTAALLARRLPLKLVVRLAMAWLAIFVIAILIVGSIPKLTTYFT